MRFHIPFTIADSNSIKRRVKKIRFYIGHKKDSMLQRYLEISESNLTREEYLAFCIRSFILTAFTIFVLLTLALYFLDISHYYLISFIGAIVFPGFILFSRLIYPKIYSNRKEREIEKNLISALGDMLVQLNAGIPLFNIMVNISASDYGELSLEFKKAIKRINAGLPQIEVLEELGEKNSSSFFKRTLWQISNGMRAGSDISIVIEDSIKSLNEEQLIQIQNYGNKLNPLIMFYMLIAVIIPSLSITFLTIISSMINLPGIFTNLLFIGLFVFVVIIQIMFLGVIKSVRPTLL